MTKIFEALEQAQRERGETPGELISVWSRGFSSEEAADVRPRVIEDAPARSLRPRLDETMTGLYQSVESLLSHSDGKTVEFIGAFRGAGTSVLVREFAKTAALSLGKSVLLLDAHGQRPRQLGFFHVRPSHGWEECVRRQTCLADAIYRIGAGKRLYVSQLSLGDRNDPSIFHLPEMGEFLEELKQDFDLVLIDSPSAERSAAGLALARKVDGLVLVVEAERTRRQVAVNVREKLEDNGAHILGVLLNKRRYPIPSFLYNRL